MPIHFTCPSVENILYSQVIRKWRTVKKQFCIVYCQSMKDNPRTETIRFFQYSELQKWSFPSQESLENALHVLPLTGLFHGVVNYKTEIDLLKFFEDRNLISPYNLIKSRDKKKKGGVNMFLVFPRHSSVQVYNCITQQTSIKTCKGIEAKRLTNTNH